MILFILINVSSFALLLKENLNKNYEAKLYFLTKNGYTQLKFDFCDLETLLQTPFYIIT